MAGTDFKKCGSIEGIFGCMMSGKSDEMCRRVGTYHVVGWKCLVVTPVGHTRKAKDGSCTRTVSRAYTLDTVVAGGTSAGDVTRKVPELTEVKSSRSKSESTAELTTHGYCGLPSDVMVIAVKELSEIDDIVHKYDVVAIDEGNRFKDIATTLDMWANKYPVRIIVAALDGTSDRTEFGDTHLLYSKMDQYVKLYAKCKMCAKDKIDKIASYSYLFNNDGNPDGGSDKYMAVCRTHYNMLKAGELLDGLDGRDLAGGYAIDYDKSGPKIVFETCEPGTAAES